MWKIIFFIAAFGYLNYLSRYAGKKGDEQYNMAEDTSDPLYEHHMERGHKYKDTQDILGYASIAVFIGAIVFVYYQFKS